MHNQALLRLLSVIRNGSDFQNVPSLSTTKNYITLHYITSCLRTQYSLVHSEALDRFHVRLSVFFLFCFVFFLPDISLLLYRQSEDITNSPDIVTFIHLKKQTTKKQCYRTKTQSVKRQLDLIWLDFIIFTKNTKSLHRESLYDML